MSDVLTVRILGCGSSGGVPRIGGADGRGEWGACDPLNPKNRRRRCSILVKRGETAVLVDTAPDMREQLIDAGQARLDAVLITHEHADQLHGIDDLRMVAIANRARVPVYGSQETMAGVNAKFGYCFATPPGSDYPAILTGHLIPRPFHVFAIEGRGGPIPVLAFDQEHGRIVSQGFRFGPIAYSSDVNGLSEDSFDALAGVEVWILDALRYKPHSSHAHVDLALSWIGRVKPRRAILTNLHTDLDFDRLARELPPGVEPAFDGLTVSALLT
jgi:phosphoribosyl 1,2-cyclic phosphate phosphodiesterase